MADFRISGFATGLTISANVFDTTGTLLGNVSPLSEWGTPPIYGGNMPGTPVLNTVYDVAFYESGDTEYSGAISGKWDGTQLVCPADGQGVWTYTPRTLTSTPAQTANAASGTALTVTRAVTFTHQFSGTIPANWEKFWFTAKDLDCNIDSESIIHIEVDPPTGGTGLVYLEGAAGTAADGALAVDQGAGTVNMTIHDDATALLLLRENREYDVKYRIDDSTTVLFASGVFNVSNTPTRTI